MIFVSDFMFFVCLFVLLSRLSKTHLNKIWMCKISDFCWQSKDDLRWKWIHLKLMWNVKDLPFKYCIDKRPVSKNKIQCSKEYQRPRISKYSISILAMKIRVSLSTILIWSTVGSCLCLWKGFNRFIQLTRGRTFTHSMEQ